MSTRTYGACSEWYIQEEVLSCQTHQQLIEAQLKALVELEIVKAGCLPVGEPRFSSEVRRHEKSREVTYQRPHSLLQRWLLGSQFFMDTAEESVPEIRFSCVQKAVFVGHVAGVLEDA